LPKLHRAPYLALFGAGREKRVYAVPPFTDVEPLDFEDHRFDVEDMAGRVCARCGASGVFMDEVLSGGSRTAFYCSDTAFCDAMLEALQDGDQDTLERLRTCAR
jgi:alpha-D-ribose 1-methylphosphonate 5-phosphate C-P lyase